mgnify:CR=1 FL=1
MPTPPSKNPFPDFDVSLLETNLGLTVQERLLAHDAALEVVLELRRVGEMLREEQKTIIPSKKREFEQNP